MLPFCTSWIYFLSVAFRAWVVHHLSGRWNLEFLVVWIGVLLVFIGVRCITGGRFWGGKGLESQKDVLEENELVGVNIIWVFLPEELLGLIRLSVCLSLLLKEIITVPSVFWAMKFGFVFSILGVGAMAYSCNCSRRFMSFHYICWGTRSLLFGVEAWRRRVCPLGEGSTMDWGSRVVFINNDKINDKEENSKIDIFKIS